MQLPRAIVQARERIIGERRVANRDKILSFCEPDIHVLVCSKAGAVVESGNGFYLVEQADGLIVDREFMNDQPAADSKLVRPGLERIGKAYGEPESCTADRGFESPADTVELEKLGIGNAICPKSPARLMKRLEDGTFCLLQKRHGAAEGRLGLFKNVCASASVRRFAARASNTGNCVLPGHPRPQPVETRRDGRAEIDAA